MTKLSELIKNSSHSILRYVNKKMNKPNRKQFFFIAFAIVFFTLSVYHFCLSTQNLSKIHLAEIPTKGNYLVTEDWPDNFDLLDPLIKFVADFNSQVEKQNILSKRINRCSGIGYLLGFITSCLSIYK